ncbi:MAG: AEC family transporter [Chloroflexi bacterium]|nr:AEC family transporter [Chloroflexota bacterium]
MTNLLAIFFDNILPIFLTAGTGFFLGKIFDIDLRSLSRVVFYIFSPSLVFRLITSNKISNTDFGRIMAFMFVCTVAIGAVTLLVGRLLKFDRRLMAAILLPVLIANTGNYGLSVSEFAFGELGLAYASIAYVTMGTMAYTLGVIVASMGTTTLKQAVVRLFKFPIVYALGVAFLVNYSDWTLPIPIDRTINLLSNAAIPAMLIVLGMQLKRIEWGKYTLAILFANLMRLVASPLIAIGLSSVIFNHQDVSRQTSILEVSMPSAVMTIILATEFDVEPAFVTTIVTTTTLFSPLTLTPLLAYLGAS